MRQLMIRCAGTGRALGSLTLALAALLGMPPGVRAGQIYVLTAANNQLGLDTVNFGTVDTTTGTFTQIASNIGSNNTVRNLAWSPTLGQFYVAWNGYSFTKLRTLDTNGVLSASLGTIGVNIYGMAYQVSNNTLFAYDFDDDYYGTINPSTGAFSLLSGSPGLSASTPVGGRFAIHAGTLYAAVNNNGTGQFGTFGYTAGSTFQAIGSSNSLYARMVLASDGTTLYGLYTNGLGTQKLYTIDPVTGALTAGPSITGTGLQAYFNGAAIVPAAVVPEPATLAGAVLGGLAALAIARRRRHDGPATA